MLRPVLHHTHWRFGACKAALLACACGALVSCSPLITGGDPTAAALSTQLTSFSILSSQSVQVTYNNIMGTGATTASNYTISGAGMNTLAAHPSTVTPISSTTYQLNWSAGSMTPGGTIVLNVTNVADASGNSVTGNLATTSVPPSTVYNMKFTGSGVAPVGMVADGSSSTDYWNIHNANANYTVTLPDQLGNPTGVSLHVLNGGGQWNPGTTTNPILRDYIYNGSGGAVTFTITGLLPGNYNIYFYGCESQGYGDSFQMNQNATNLGTQITTCGADWDAIWGANGSQFVTFSVTAAPGDSFTTVANKVGPNIDATVNAIQIVKK